MLRSVGPVNESVGGVATAMPISASGAIFWNPASISALDKNSIEIGVGLIQPHSRTAYTNADLNINDSRKSQAGITPVPSMSFVWRKNRQSPFTYGVGLAGVGGASALYPYTGGADDFLAKSSNVIVMQITPTVSAQITKQWSVGIAPIVDLASLNINPMPLGGSVATPLASYGTRYAWGGGFQVGTYYDFQNHFKAGFMVKSPIWTEELQFTGVNASGQSDARSFDMDLPLTLSAGIAYDGFKNTIIGVDLRYFDYAHTAGFKNGLTGFNVDGLAWDSVVAVAVGAEHAFTNKIKGRIGYCFNENPIPGRSSVLNVAAPLMIQHVLSFGFGYTFAKDLELSASYCHAFKSSITGPAMLAPGNITNEVSADTGSIGITKKW
ncbi:hypothetical protein FACS189454_05320 [Planctomycetales bacterium]|nr:hypothetical protein FACS189454_05320 [Planctomycetales bacterium]